MLFLLGYGKTNQAIADKFSPCYIFDDNFKEVSKDSKGNTLLPSNQLKDYLEKYPNAQIITSPGIPPQNPMIKLSQPISEYDFFASTMPFSVWISGTNGKTTTTQMLTHLLQNKGALSGGNIGTPLANLNPKAPLWILETSSFTIHYTNIARPNLYLLLPITQDHISWHGNYESYIADKLKPLLSMKDKEIAIIPQSLQSHSFCQKTLAKLFFYSDSQSLAKQFFLDLNKITFKEPFLLDAILALSATRILFNEVDYDLLNSFKIGAHKIEEFFDSQNRLWVDDSKGTNLDATMEAIKRYQNKALHLILGGDDKGADLTPLFALIEKCQITLYAIGSNTQKITLLAKDHHIPCFPCHTLEIAVQEIHKHHTQQSIAMLSPAAASLDQFSSYKERGDKFKVYVQSL